MSTEEKYNSHRDINNRKHKKNNGNKLKKIDHYLHLTYTNKIIICVLNLASHQEAYEMNEFQLLLASILFYLIVPTIVF